MEYKHKYKKANMLVLKTVKWLPFLHLVNELFLCSWMNHWLHFAAMEWVTSFSLGKETTSGGPLGRETSSLHQANFKEKHLRCREMKAEHPEATIQLNKCSSNYSFHHYFFYDITLFYTCISWKERESVHFDHFFNPIKWPHT